MSAAREANDAAAEAAIWQDVEFGAYAADLPLWEELAENPGGAVLEIGAGSGRVALHLARRGSPVIALERDPALVEQLRRRSEGLPLSPIAGDAGHLHAASIAADANGTPPVGCVIAPLHLIQQIDPDRRPALLRDVARILPGGGRFAATVVDESSLLGQGVGRASTTPDMRDVEGWVYSSEPLWVQVGARALTVRRLRERVSPEGEIERSVRDEVLNRLAPEELEREASDAGLHPVGRREISSGPSEADSIAVMFEAGVSETSGARGSG